MRSLSFSLFVRILIGLALVGGLRLFAPGGWGGWTAVCVVAVLWAGLNALVLGRSVRSSAAVLAAAAAAVPERRVRVGAQPLSDLDEVGSAISEAADRVGRVLAEASESRRELEAMIDSMQDAVVAVDATGRIQWTNQHMQRLMPGASIGNAVRLGHALVQTIRDPEVLACMRAAMEERVVREGRSTSIVPGKIFEVSASPMPGGGAVAVLHDITRIEEVEQAHRDFVANVSHELRTPLTSIGGYVETLLDHEASLSAQAREFLTTILKNANRMGRLTEDLLVMARVESSQELHLVPVRADVLVRDAVKAMNGLVQDEGAVLEVGEMTDSEVSADTDAALQVLSNLIENAIKYGQPRGEKHARVMVSARNVSEPVGVVEFSVQDFGQGIGSEHLGRIFERFYRVDKARSRESGGTGLGLAIARHIVQSQGGTIRAESELNEGSKFVFTLPRVNSSVS